MRVSAPALAGPSPGGPPPRAVSITFARSLRARAERSARTALLMVVFAWIALVSVALMMARLTSQVLATFGSTLGAVVISVLLHLSIGVCVHLLCLGADDVRERRHRVIGTLGLGASIAVLLGLAVLRVSARLTTGAGSPVLVLGTSICLLLLEIVVPGLAGYLVAVACRRYEAARQEADFYQDLDLRVETGDGWEDAWERQLLALQDEIRERQRRVGEETPEEVTVLVKEIRLREARLTVLKANHPNVRVLTQGRLDGAALGPAPEADEFYRALPRENGREGD